MKPKAEHLDRIRAAETLVVAATSCEDADDSLVDRSCREVSPFDAIYDTYAPLLRKIAVVKFSIPADDAADLVHDVFASYLSNPARVGNLRPYLIGAICNASRSHVRRMAVQSAACCSVDECDVASDEQLTEMVVRNLLIGRILGRLGRSCRDALHSFYIRGETASAIAERRHTSAGYIGRLLHFCRQRARDAYQAIERGER